ncbi:unnamed protein product [Amoebophrya sp. A25]|nr:unnamed protein product [Amoebophrya sp. A25]|eukprot:GSA25T00006452001.1
MSDKHTHTVINEILPKAGLVYSEKGNLSEMLCKPKIMPLKSSTLQKLETAEKALEEEVRKKNDNSFFNGAANETSHGGPGANSGGSSQVMSFA